MEGNLLVVGLAVLAFGIFAGRLRGTPITMPMVFTAAGLLFGSVLGVLDLQADRSVVSGLAEASLVVVLFTDASRMQLRTVIREHGLALRLLLIGLPLAIVVGAAAGWMLFPGLSVAAVALTAAVLAPTDAALGQAFVANTTVPARIRQTLNVESGLNDGLAVPFITVLIDIARHEADSAVSYVKLFLALVGIGVGIGILVGWLGGTVLSWAARRQWTTDATQRLATMSLAAIAYAGSELLGGNGFVAVFTAGLVVGTTAKALLPHTTAFAEAEGQLLTLLTFLVFGAIMVYDLLADFDWKVLVYALLSLLVVRPIAVAMSLIGTHLKMATVGFVAWAGPRGLASIVYAVLILDTAGIPGATEIFRIAGWTILLSIYLHGLTAAPISARYGASMQGGRRKAPQEHADVTALPLRLPAARPGAHSGSTATGPGAVRDRSRRQK